MFLPSNICVNSLYVICRCRLAPKCVVIKSESKLNGNSLNCFVADIIYWKSSNVIKPWPRRSNNWKARRYNESDANNKDSKLINSVIVIPI